MAKTSPRRALVIFVAICSISIALVLSPWNTASLRTTLAINATAAVVREKIRFPYRQCNDSGRRRDRTKPPPPRKLILSLQCQSFSLSNKTGQTNSAPTSASSTSPHLPKSPTPEHCAKAIYSRSRSTSARATPLSNKTPTPSLRSKALDQGLQLCIRGNSFLRRMN